MRPRMFIGSSGEGSQIALAIQANLPGVDCTCWFHGAFSIASSTLDDLINLTTTSDFATFVFTPDDLTASRGGSLNSPRDNVVYELGLFSGAIGKARCFIALPSSTPLKLPTDLAGVTYGKYDDTRSDQNHRAALGTVCYDISEVVKKHGNLERQLPAKFIDIAVRYDCCKWIDDANRVVERDKYFSEMIYFCRYSSVK